MRAHHNDKDVKEPDSEVKESKVLPKFYKKKEEYDKGGVRVVKLPDIPPQVDFADIDLETGLLVAASEVKLLEELLKDNEKWPAGRYSKAQLGKGMAELSRRLIDEGRTDIVEWPDDKPATRGIQKNKNGDLYAVYKGERYAKELGKGGYGKVKLAQNIKTGEWEALKVQQMHPLMEQEHKALKETEGSHGEMVYRMKMNSYKFHFIMKYVKGVDFFKLLFYRAPILPAIQWLDTGLFAVQCIHDLHKKGYLHCDIKLENMMCDLLNNRVSAIDLGFALKMNPKGVAVAAGLRGTEGYLAPELRPSDVDNSNREYSRATDIYALGIMLKELYGFNGVDRVNRLSPFRADKELEALLNRMIDSDPEKRPSLPEVIKKLQNFRKQLLPVVPRITGLVNLQEYLSATLAEQTALRTALKSVHTVVFTHLTPPEYTEEKIRQYAEIRRVFEKEGMVVRNELLISASAAEMVKKATDLDRKNNKDYTLVPCVCYFSNKEKPALLKEEKFIRIKNESYKKTISDKHRSQAIFAMGLVTEQDLKNIQMALMDQINHLYKNKMNQDDYKPTIEALTVMIKQFEFSYRQETLTFSKLISELRTLQATLLEHKNASSSTSHAKLINKVVRQTVFLERKSQPQFDKSQANKNQYSPVPAELPKMKR